MPRRPAKDEREAARLYKLAADEGNASVQAYLGDFYEFARGGLANGVGEAARSRAMELERPRTMPEGWDAPAASAGRLPRYALELGDVREPAVGGGE